MPFSPDVPPGVVSTTLAMDFNNCLADTMRKGPGTHIVESEACATKLLDEVNAASPEVRKHAIDLAAKVNHERADKSVFMPIVNSVVSDNGEITKFQLQIPSISDAHTPTRIIDFK